MLPWRESTRGQGREALTTPGTERSKSTSKKAATLLEVKKSLEAIVWEPGAGAEGDRGALTQPKWDRGSLQTQQADGLHHRNAEGECREATLDSGDREVESLKARKRVMPRKAARTPEKRETAQK